MNTTQPTRAERMNNYLATLVSMPTNSDDIAANKAGLDYIANFFEARGMYVARYQHHGRDSFVATVKPGIKNPKVMLAAHIDVVPANASMYTLRQEDGKLIGRGVYDMKFAIAAYMEFVDSIKHELNRYDFGVLITGDEEIAGSTGFSGTEDLVNEGYLPSVYILPDGGGDWQLETATKGYLHFTLEARGVSAHGSRPWLGDNAAYKIIDAVQALRHHYRDQHQHGVTFNVGIIEGGDMPNKIPDYMRAEIDIRPTTAQEMRHLQKLIPAICKEHGVTTTVRNTLVPLAQSLDNPYLADFAQSIKKITGVTCKGYLSLGGSDARFLVSKGVPCAVFYPIGGDHHSESEWIDETAFHQTADVIEDYVKKIAHISTPAVVSRFSTKR